MAWKVTYSRKVQKALKGFNEDIQRRFHILFDLIRVNGPWRSEMPNFGKLTNTELLHCHLKKGNPTYTCVWEIKDKEIRVVEVKYVGTHEKAPY